MIKFTANIDDNQTLVGLGLSHKNLERLKDGHPIKIVGASIGLPDLELFIFAGSTEEAMAAQLDPLISANTTVINKDPS